MKAVDLLAFPRGPVMKNRFMLAPLRHGCRLFKLVAVVTITLGLAGCGEPEPVLTSLSALAAAQKDFDGRQVILSGTLRTFDEPRHYWIENESLDRVAVRGDFDFAQWVGETIEVRGRFAYDTEAGRRIQVQDLVVQPPQS